MTPITRRRLLAGSVTTAALAPLATCLTASPPTPAFGQSMRVQANGISINYRIDGPADAPWLIFSNSLATDLGMWDDQAAHFSGRFRVLRYDQRGHGGTDAPQGRYSFDMMFQDVIALMDALGVKRAHFCGLSMGAGTGLGLAQRHADRFDRMILCDNGFRSSPALAKMWDDNIAKARQGGMAALVDGTMARWFPADTRASPARVAKVRQMILATPVDGYVGCAAALSDYDVRTGAGKVRLPVLLVCGEKDGGNPAIMQELCKEMAPGTRYVSIPGAAHISNVDDPAFFNRVVDEFLA